MIIAASPIAKSVWMITDAIAMIRLKKSQIKYTKGNLLINFIRIYLYINKYKIKIKKINI